MNPPTCAVVLTTTVETEEQALTLARRMLDERLVACVQLDAQVRSLYRWEGALEDAREVRLTCKTVRERIAGIEALFAAAHPYRVPELLVTEVVHGGAAYLAWVDENTRDAAP